MPRSDGSRQVVRCGVIEILDQPNISSSDNTTDCSRNSIEREAKSVQGVGGPATPLLSLLPTQR